MLIIYFDTLHAKLHEYFSTGLIETSLYICTVNQQYSFIHENVSHEKQLNKIKHSKAIISFIEMACLKETRLYMTAIRDRR